MTTYSSRQELEKLVVTRHREGWTARALARDLSISRSTVRKILAKAAKQRRQGHAPVDKPDTVRRFDRRAALALAAALWTQTSRSG